MATAKTDRDWEEKYNTGNTPWDSDLASQELQIVLADAKLPPGTAIDLGCGTGTNAVYLAKQGWQVTGVDCVSQALKQAKQKADAASVNVTWIKADVQNFGADSDPVDLVFDRGCYHCCRRVDLDGYFTTLKNITHPGSHMLCLCGNPNEEFTGGPPRVAEEDIRREFESLFEIIHLRTIHFEDAGGVQGPLGWSVWMRRN